MENKTTTELLDILVKIERTEGEKADWDRFGDAYAELRKRSPFSDIFGSKDDSNDPTHEERLENLEKTVKELKRHKHDEKTGDVMIRI